MSDEINHPFYYRNLASSVDPKTRTGHILKLQEIAHSLGLPYYTISTCSFLYHRFTAAYPLPPTEILLTGCLSLGMKIEETFKKLADIYSQAQYILNDENLEYKKEEMKLIRDGVMDVERLLMEDLRFDVRIVAPHRFALSFCKWVDANEGIAEEAWKILNDSYLTDISLKYPPHTIAFASVLCGFRLLGNSFTEMLKDDKTYRNLSSSLADVADVGQVLMSMYVESKAQTDAEKLTFGKIWREFVTITEVEAEKKRQLLEKLENEKEFRKSQIASHQSNSHQYRERSRYDSRGYIDRRDSKGDRPSSSSRLNRDHSREDLRPGLGREIDYPRYNRYNDRPGAIDQFDRRHTHQTNNLPHPHQAARERSRERMEERPSKFARSDSREWHGDRSRSREQPRPATRHSYGGRQAPRAFHRDEKPYRK